jgi:hypothetical protein
MGMEDIMSDEGCHTDEILSCDPFVAVAGHAHMMDVYGTGHGPIDGDSKN